MIDLSKAKVGDTVKFRCGGEAVIKTINNLYPDGGDTYKWQLHFDGDSYADDKLYQSGGTRRGTGVVTRFDIVSHIPKPFDWKDVKAGMAFRYLNGGNDGRIWIFVGIRPYDKNDYIFSRRDDDKLDYYCLSDMTRGKHTVERAPEHDITEAA